MAGESSTSEQPLFVRCQTWLEFIERYASDLSQGRLFVATETPPTVMTVLDLRLELPESSEVVLRARVVQVFAPDPVRRTVEPTGIGLELVDMDPDRKRQVAQLVEFAQRQLEQPDPDASLSRMLLELSPTLAPSEVGYRLSLLPGATPRSSDSARRRSGTGLSKVDPSRIRRGESRPIDIRFDEPRQPPAESRPISINADAPRETTNQPESRPISINADAPRETTNQPESRPISINADAARPAQPAKPTDPIKLKVLLTEFAHKRYQIALRHAGEMLEDNPGDPQVLRWQCMCHARLAVLQNDPIAAADQYEMALAYDDDNREAREYVRTHRRDKKLNAIPFGRYFTKKK